MCRGVATPAPDGRNRARRLALRTRGRRAFVAHQPDVHRPARDVDVHPVHRPRHLQPQGRRVQLVVPHRPQLLCHCRRPDDNSMGPSSALHATHRKPRRALSGGEVRSARSRQQGSVCPGRAPARLRRPRDARALARRARSPAASRRPTRADKRAVHGSGERVRPRRARLAGRGRCERWELRSDSRDSVNFPPLSVLRPVGAGRARRTATRNAMNVASSCWERG